MFCIYCRYPLEETDKVCAFCGREVKKIGLKPLRPRHPARDRIKPEPEPPEKPRPDGAAANLMKKPPVRIIAALLGLGIIVTICINLRPPHGEDGFPPENPPENERAINSENTDSGDSSDESGDDGGLFDGIDLNFGGDGGGEIFANATVMNNDSTQICPAGDKTVFIPTQSAPEPVYLIENGSDDPPAFIADAIYGFENVVIGDDLYSNFEPERFTFYLKKLSLEDGEETLYEDVEAESIRYDGESLYTLNYMIEDEAYVLSKIDTDSMAATETYAVEDAEPDDYMVLDGKLYYREAMERPFYSVLDLATGETSSLAPQGEDSFYKYLCGDDESVYYYYEGDKTVYALPHGSGAATPILDASSLGGNGVSRLFADGNYVYAILHEEGSGMSALYRPYRVRKGGSAIQKLPVAISDFNVALGGWLHSGGQYYHIVGDEITEIVYFEKDEPMREKLETPMQLEEIE